MIMTYGFIGLVTTGLILGLAGTAVAQDRNMEHNKHRSSMFDRFDSNQDGSIDRAEVESKLSQRFSQMDTDGDGVVSQAEMRDFHEKMREERRQKRQDKMFKKYDTDGDGVLSSEELSARSLTMFDRMDKDGDGVVTMEERKAARMDMKKSKHGKYGKKGDMKKKMDDGGR